MGKTAEDHGIGRKAEGHGIDPSSRYGREQQQTQPDGGTTVAAQNLFKRSRQAFTVVEGFLVLVDAMASFGMCVSLECVFLGHALLSDSSRNHSAAPGRLRPGRQYLCWGHARVRADYRPPRVPPHWLDCVVEVSISHTTVERHAN
jgi:hypothetical protein